jgi:hypothetical protein
MLRRGAAPALAGEGRDLHRPAGGRRGQDLAFARHAAPNRMERYNLSGIRAEADLDRKCLVGGRCRREFRSVVLRARLLEASIGEDPIAPVEHGSSEWTATRYVKNQYVFPAGSPVSSSGWKPVRVIGSETAGAEGAAEAVTSVSASRLAAPTATVQLRINIGIRNRHYRR